MTRARLAFFALLTVLLAVCGIALVSSDTASAADPGVLYVSGLEIGKGNKAILRVDNATPALGDLYVLNIGVFETSAGRRINALSGATFNLFPGEIRDFDIGAIVKAHQASLGDGGNTKFTGPVQVVVSATGGPVNPFGPDTIATAALQSRGKAQFPTHIRWLRR